MHITTTGLKYNSIKRTYWIRFKIKKGVIRTYKSISGEAPTIKKRLEMFFLRINNKNVIRIFSGMIIHEVQNSVLARKLFKLLKNLADKKPDTNSSMFNKASQYSHRSHFL